jgi:hypothetical protein
MMILKNILVVKVQMLIRRLVEEVFGDMKYARPGIYKR